MEEINEKKDFEEDLIDKRKKKIFGFLNIQKDRIYYLILAFIVFISVYIRSRNIPKLKDVTTGNWTLGPDLDPFLFLRWAEYIVEHGKLMAVDMMRYVPRGFDTSYEMKLLPYLIAWFHDIISFLSLSDSVTYSAIIFPVFMAALTAIAFFLFARKIFYKEDNKIKNIIALIATAFFVLVPSLLPRTIAGIPEKESAAFFFMFMAFYFFLEAFTCEKFKKSLIFGLLAGIMTGMMALIWGGFIFVFSTIPVAVLFAFVLGKIDTKKYLIYSLWLFSSILVMLPFSTRYNLSYLIHSLYTSFSLLVFVIIGICFLMKDKLKNMRVKTKLPKEIFYPILTILFLVILISIILGPMFVLSQINDVKNSLTNPMTTRFGLTVAENKQPYFTDWKESFGPVVSNIPLFFWLFFIGSIVMFGSLIKSLRKKEKIILLLGYFIFLFGLIFSRYSSNSVLNGISGLSLIMYFGAVLFFIGSLFYVYYKRYNEGGFEIFKEFRFSYILYFIILTVSIVGARGGIRLIMVLAVISCIAISLLIVKSVQRYLKEKEDTMKFFIGICVLIILISSIFTLWVYYQSDKSTSENFAPTIYTVQWQKAMGWVRENTPVDAVFAHWWDYGYWIQSIGERATILDGSNSIIYWNHLLGRHVLTGISEKDALEFLYAHGGTHLLIDSTDIGKYTAYSSIGADENYDRFSWISTFIMDETRTTETNNENIYFYSGGHVLDEDILWEFDGKEILLPGGNAGVGAIIVNVNQNGKISQPEEIVIYNSQQYVIPLRYAYYQNELIDFGSGLDAGIFIYPSVKVSSNNQVNLNNIGALLYLSKRTIHSNLANLYLFDNSENFKLVHSEENLIVQSLKEQGLNVGNFVQYQGFQGPIKIWEVNYPSNIEFKEEYLETQYPNEELRLAQPGRY